MENNIFKKQVMPFTQVPNGLLYDPRVSLKAKGLWAYMNAKPEGWNFSADRIAKETKEDRKAVLSGLKELVEYGYLSAKKRSDGRMEYTLFWEASDGYETKTASKPKPIEAPEEPEDEAGPYPEAVPKAVEVPDGPRPFRSHYASDEEFEKAMDEWNRVLVSRAKSDDT